MDWVGFAMLTNMGTLHARGMAVLAVGIFALAGCSAQVPTEPVAISASAAPSADPAASENQVASVIAEREADWREVIDNAITCRTDWALSPGKMSNLSCYLQEQTIINTAQLALRDFADLKVPASMSSLVDSTTVVLEQIGAVDLQGACGEGMVEPADSPECNEALGTLNFLYMTLGDKLDAWGPYL